MKHPSINIRNNIPFALTSFIASTCTLLGASFDATGSFHLLAATASSVIISIFIFCIQSVIFYFGQIYFYSFISKIYKEETLNYTPKRGLIVFIFSFIAIFLCFFPYLISSYPGSINTDSISQYQMGLGIDSLSDHHPVLVTFLMAGCYNIGFHIADKNFGIFLYTLLQSTVFVSGLANSVRVMFKLRLPRMLTIISLLFWGLFPLFGGFSQFIVKDTIYSGAFMLFCSTFTELMMQNKSFPVSRTTYILYTIFGLLTIFSRHNGIYIVISTTIILILTSYKQRKSFAIILILFLLFNLLFSSVLLPALNIQKGSIKEMLSLPFQATARYLKENPEDVTTDERAAIAAILDYDSLASNYTFYGSDPVKNTYHCSPENEKQLLIQYFKVWCKMFVKHPDSYIRAFIAQTYYYYCPNSTESFEPVYLSFVYSDSDSTFTYTQSKHFETLKNTLVKISDFLRNFPVTGTLYSLGFYTLMHLSFIAYGIIKKNKHAILIALPSCISILICMASPVNGSFRYYLPVIAFSPLVFGITIRKNSSYNLS